MIQQTISPVDGRVYVERPLAGVADIDRALSAAVSAQQDWRNLGVAGRCALLSRAVDAFVSQRDAIATELTRQMGRPIAQSPGEVRGFEERARYMLGIAATALAPIIPEEKSGFRRDGLTSFHFRTAH